MKKILCVLLVVLMCLTAAPLGGFAELDLGLTASALSSTGKCGKDATYTFDSETGELFISGTGAIAAEAFYKNKEIKNVIISDGITEIGNDAFNDSSITSVTIPDSVTTIGYAAFRSCDRLTSITIPDSVTTIGNYAFFDCNSLTSVTIGNSVTTIGDSAFCSCNSLTNVTIGYSVTTIGDNTFAYCDNLTSVTIPDSVTTIGDSAFFDCTSLTSVTIGDNVTTIGESAFFGCYSLTSVTIGDSVTTIGYAAFTNCNSLTSVTLPDSVTTIGGGAFLDCNRLTSVTIGDSVTTIGNYAFADCDSLTSVTIPDSVTTIGDSAFGSCDSLTSVTIPDSVTTIGDYAFEYCNRLTSVTIPDSVTTIGDSAFGSCDSLTSVTIGDSVTTIGSYAFNNCSSLESINIPKSVTYIGNEAFRYCSSLYDVYYEGSEENWNAIEIGENNTGLDNATIHFGEVMPECQHEYVWVARKVSTCTEKGWIGHFVCKGCNAFFKNDAYKTEITLEELTMPLADHTEETLIAKESTCTETGLTEGKKCSVCNEILVAQIGTEKKAHNFDNGVCTACGATCDGHTGGTATCEEQATCTKCGQKYGPLADHTEVVDAAVAATCTTEGKTEGKHCSVCNEIIVAQTTIEAKGHGAIAGFDPIGAVEATCTTTGNTAGKFCKACEEYYDGYEVIEALGHTWSENIIKKDDDKHGKKCSICNEFSDLADHAYTETTHKTLPNCVTEGSETKKCACGDTKTETLPVNDNHDWGAFTEIKAPTCTEIGIKERACKREGCTAKDMVEIILATEHTYSEEKVITITPTCTSEGKKAIICVNCGEKKSGTEEVVPPTHSYPSTWSVVIAPDCQNTGFAVKVCFSCHDVIAQKVPKAGHADLDGDNKCDTCDKEIIVAEPEEPTEPDTPNEPEEKPCDCDCHAGGIKAFFFKLINFFAKIFDKSARVCKCGASH